MGRTVSPQPSVPCRADKLEESQGEVKHNPQGDDDIKPYLEYAAHASRSVKSEKTGAVDSVQSMSVALTHRTNLQGPPKDSPLGDIRPVTEQGMARLVQNVKENGDPFPASRHDTSY